MIASGGIDGCVFLGRDEATGRDAGVDSQFETLDEMGAGRALTVAFGALRYDWRAANAALRVRAAADARILPAAALNLPGYDAGEGVVATLRRDGFRAVALVSDVMGWTLQGPALHALARECARERMPLLLCAATGNDLANADRVAEAGGPVLLRWTRAHGYFQLADLVALARTHPNVLVDVGSQSQTGAIAHLAGRIGPERLFVASGAPLAHPGCAWFMLAAAGIDADSRDLIAGRNLARVLGVDGAVGWRPPARYAGLSAAAKIDTHWHTSRWNLIETRTSFADLRALADRAGIANFVSSSIRALSDDLAEGNAETAALLDADPRARGLVVVNPLRPEASRAEIAKYRDDPRFVGVKTIQDFYGLGLDDTRYRDLLPAVAEVPDWPVMAHLPGMADAARRFPSIRFVAAHATWRYADLLDCPNVWFDVATSSPRVAEADIAALVAAAGASRVLFSSDAPLIDPAWTLGKLAGAGLDAAALASIFAHAASNAFPRLRR